jgi:hypothetical protein
LCQNSQIRDQLAPLPLVIDSVASDNFHTELTASALAQQVVNNDCRDAFHTVSNVRTNAGDANALYFSIEFSVTSGTAVLFRLYDPANDFDLDILTTNVGSIPSSSTGQCNAGQTCRFDYYCDIYKTSSSLQVIVNTPDGTTATEFTVYDITFIQYDEVVGTIPTQSRTLLQSTPASDPFQASNLGPANFRQYYHDLSTSIEERGDAATLFVEVTGFDVTVSGSGFVCVSFSNAVASTNNLVTVNNLALDANGL